MLHYTSESVNCTAMCLFVASLCLTLLGVVNACTVNFNNPCCPIGNPLQDNSGGQIFCGRGLNRQDCPSGSTCHISSTDRWAVCCADEEVCSGRSVNPCCTIGNPIIGGNGGQLFCGRGPNRQNCPPGSTCFISSTDRWAVCCADEEVCSGRSVNPCCTIGNPLVDANGDQLFCGRGPNRQNCPPGSTCFISSTDRWAVCCADEDVCTVSSVNPCCTIGNPLLDASGGQLFCGRGPNRQDCPPGYICHISSTDRWAVCCAVRRKPCKGKRRNRMQKPKYR